MPKKKKTDKRKPTPEEVKRALEREGTEKYWREVDKRLAQEVAREIDALGLR